MAFDMLSNMSTVKSAPRVINLAILGVGVVGSELLSQIDSFNKRSQKTGLDIVFHVVFLARSNRYIMPKGYLPIDLATWRDLLSVTPNRTWDIEALEKFLENSDPPAIFVDNTTCEGVAALYPRLLRKGINIATPNKKGFSSSTELFNKIMLAQRESSAMILHESTVGAGLPILSTLRDLILTGDEIYKIQGILSGTLSFIFNEWSKPAPGSETQHFSKIVLQAKHAGYTEPDPRDDLNGMDVARKLTILARLCGLDTVTLESIRIESLIPNSLAKVSSIDEFLAQLPDYDNDFQGRLDEARKEGNCIRYIASLDVQNSNASVAMETVSASHPFAGLQKSDNIVAFYTKRYPEQPLIIQGAGAGASVTAMGVLADIIKISERRPISSQPINNLTNKHLAGAVTEAVAGAADDHERFDASITTVT